MSELYNLGPDSIDTSTHEPNENDLVFSKIESVKYDLGVDQSGYHRHITITNVKTLNSCVWVPLVRFEVYGTIGVISQTNVFLQSIKIDAFKHYLKKIGIDSDNPNMLTAIEELMWQVNVSLSKQLTRIAINEHSEIVRHGVVIPASFFASDEKLATAKCVSLNIKTLELLGIKTGDVITESGDVSFSVLDGHMNTFKYDGDNTSFPEKEVSLIKNLYPWSD